MNTLLKIIILGFFFNSAAYANEEVIKHIYGASVRDFMASVDNIRDVYLKDQERGGLFLTTMFIPGAGRLLVTNQITGERTSCSGIAISSRFFLSAAHCICGVSTNSAKSAASCQDILAKLSIMIFLPQFGLIQAVGVPIIHPSYRSPQTIIPGSPSVIADLTLIQLKRPFPIGHQALGGGEGALVLNSFGYLYSSVEPQAVKLGFPVGEPLQSGIGQITKYKTMYNDSDSCGEMFSTDTFCTLFSGLVFNRGPLQDASICRGDSGAPLLQQTDNGEWSLVGIASYFSPKGNDQCLANLSKRNHFIAIDTYKNWIDTTISSQDIEDKDITQSKCAEGMFKSTVIDLFNFSGIISVTAASSYSGDDFTRPTISIVAENSVCSTDEAFGITSCYINKDSFVSSSVSDGFGQWTICLEHE